MKKLLFLAALCCVALTACKKENVDTEDPNGNPYSAFVGTYNMVIACDSLSTDGEWYSNEYYGQLTGEPEEDMYGTLSITLSADGKSVEVLGTIEDEGEEPLVYYHTTGTLDQQGNLVMETSSVTAPTGYVVRSIYGKAAPTLPLVFRTETHFDMGGYDFGYIQTNTCTRR